MEYIDGLNSDNDIIFNDFTIHNSVLDPIDYVAEGNNLFENYDLVSEFIKFNNDPSNMFLDEAAYQDRINDHFSLEIMDQNKFIKNNEVQEITNPTFFSASGGHTSDGLLSDAIFGITQAQRAGTFGYINLVEDFIDPSCYKTLYNIDKQFKAIVNGTKHFIIDDKGNLVQDEDRGNTGIKWLKNNFSKLSFVHSGSRIRDIRIRYLLTNFKRGRMFINKWIVIPAYYRDVNTSGKYTGVGAINKYYASLLTCAKALKENNDYGLSMADTTCARVEDTLVLIYDWFCGNRNANMQDKDKGTGMSGKFGVLRRANMSKTTDYSSRLVMCAPELKVERASDLMVDLDKSAIPLAAAAADFFPFMMFNMRSFFENDFQGLSKYPVETPNGVEYLPLQAQPMEAFTDNILEKHLKKYLYDPNTRFEPIELPIDRTAAGIPKNQTVYMRFKGYRGVHDEEAAQHANPESIVNRELTWLDVIYIAAKASTKGKMMSFTRYPFDSFYNTIYTHIEISTTKETEPMYVNHEFYQFYPKVRHEDINTPTGNKFIDVMQVSNLYLGGLGADYDGDTGVAKGSFFEETNREQEEFVKSKVNFVSLGCSPIRASTNESVQATYNLTKILNADKNKLTNPTF